MKVLLVEDDDGLRDVVFRALTEAGHVVDCAADGITGESMGGDDSYDVIVLDLMLPRRDGLTIIRSLRELGITTPILCLTARVTEEDSVAGLDAGADDYLRKPFGLSELLARLRSIARRDRLARPTAVTCGSISYDPISRRARRYERELRLTQREMVFLEYFVRNSGRVLSRDMIAAALWPSDAEIGSNVIDVYVKRLRAKLHAPGEPNVLRTIRGIGYRLEDN